MNISELDYLLQIGFPLELISVLRDKEELTLSEIAQAVANMYDRGETLDGILAPYRDKYPELFDCGIVSSDSFIRGFGFYRVDELTAAERTPPEFIVHGMIPCGLTFISGAPKTRKSFFALQMAASVAAGVPFLGHSTTRCEVAYFDLEGSKSRISSRSAKMSVSVGEGVLVSNSLPHSVADGLCGDLVRLHQAKPELRLFIVDTYSRARGNAMGFGGNAYDADVALLDPLQRAALDGKFALVFVHHDRKGAALSTDSFERLNGTMGISGSADCVLNLGLEGKRAEGKAVLECNPRDARGWEKRLEFDECCNEWRVMADERVDVLGNPVCAWLVNHPPERGKIGDFHTYANLSKAYGAYIAKPGDVIPRAIKPFLPTLYTDFGLGVQLGVKSNGERGLRVINLS